MAGNPGGRPAHGRRRAESGLLLQSFDPLPRLSAAGDVELPLLVAGSGASRIAPAEALRQ